MVAGNSTEIATMKSLPVACFLLFFARNPANTGCSAQTVAQPSAATTAAFAVSVAKTAVTHVIENYIKTGNWEQIGCPGVNENKYVWCRTAELDDPGNALSVLHPNPDFFNHTANETDPAMAEVVAGVFSSISDCNCDYRDNWALATYPVAGGSMIKTSLITRIFEGDQTDTCRSDSNSETRGFICGMGVDVRPVEEVEALEPAAEIYSGFRMTEAKSAVKNAIHSWQESGNWKQMGCPDVEATARFVFCRTANFEEPGNALSLLNPFPAWLNKTIAETVPCFIPAAEGIHESVADCPCNYRENWGLTKYRRPDGTAKTSLITRIFDGDQTDSCKSPGSPGTPGFFCGMGVELLPIEKVELQDQGEGCATLDPVPEKWAAFALSDAKTAVTHVIEKWQSTGEWEQISCPDVNENKYVWCRTAEIDEPGNALSVLHPNPDLFNRTASETGPAMVEVVAGVFSSISDCNCDYRENWALATYPVAGGSVMKTSLITRVFEGDQTDTCKSNEGSETPGFICGMGVEAADVSGSSTESPRSNPGSATSSGWSLGMNTVFHIIAALVCLGYGPLA